MHIRPKTLRRLLILFTGTVIVAAAIASWLLMAQHRMAQRNAASRKEALAAYTAGNYVGAASLFADYLTRSHAQDSDAEVVFDYADSLVHLPSESSRHRYEAIRLLEHYLTLQEDDGRDARHLLLKLYTQARFNKEARSLAEKLLEKNPQDVEALRCRAESLESDSEALAAYHRLNQLTPHNFSSQLREMELMARLHQTPAQIAQHANELVQQHPDDPVAHALLSVAQLVYVRDDAAAKKDIRAAAALRPPDPETVLQLVRLLDMQQEFQLSDDLLNRCITEFPNAPQLSRQLVQRSWQRRGAQAVVDRLANIDASKDDSELLGYKAMALYELNRPAEARTPLNVLRSRSDHLATAWAMAVQITYVDRPAAVVAIRKYTDAIERAPANPLFYLLRGQCYETIGETEQAIRQWKEAGRLSPCWALPYCFISRTLCDAGRYSDALSAAEAAHQRLPGSQIVETSYALAWYGLNRSGTRQPDAKEQAALFALLENIQKAWKNEPLTLPAYVSMLSRRGNREAAIGLVRDVLNGTSPPPLQTLLNLQVVSRQEKLALDQEIFDRADKAYPDNASLALAKALDDAHAGNAQAAVKTFEKAAGKHEHDADWQVDRAQLADALGDPDALKLWSRAADDNAKSLFVQHALLLSPTRLRDRSLWRRTIDRVQTIIGPEARLVQLEDVRWKLASNASPKDLETITASLQKIINVAPGDPEPRRVLAVALLRQAAPDSISKAVTELTAAHDLQPGNLEVTEQLAELLGTEGSRDQAVALVNAITLQVPLAPEQRLWAAAMYGKLARPQAGIDLLSGSHLAADREADRQSMLAQLYRQSGKVDEAATAYLNLLDDPGASADALAAGAEFFAGLKKLDNSSRFVSRLGQLALKAGSLAILRAHLDQLAGNGQRAIEELTAAAKASPKVEQVWQELSGAYLRIGNFAAADRAASEGLSANPQSALLSAMRRQLSRLRSLSAQEAAPLLEVICHDPQQPVLDRVLKLLADSKSPKTGSQHVADDLRELADQHMQFLPLQLVAAQELAVAGRFKEAADVASRAAVSAPDDPAPLRLLSAIQSSAGDWDSARQTALRWRQRPGIDPIEPDLVIARSYLQPSHPDPAAVLKQLASYISPDAPEHARLAALPLYARALIMSDRSAEAASLLEPGLAQSKQSRLIWLQLATAPHQDADAAIDWLKKVVPFLSDSIEDKLALADAWEQIGQRYDSTPAHQAARQALQPLMAGTNVSPEAWATWATISQSLNDIPEAEHGWREYLRKRPDDALAKNNLAYMLLMEGSQSQLAEAEQLARSAIAASPNISTFYDSLARIELRLGRTDNAVKDFHAALDRNDKNLEAMIGLADVLASRSQDRDELKALMLKVDSAIRAGAAISDPLRKQFDRVKNAVSSSL